MSNQKIILLSGGCDPINFGYIKLIDAASKYGKVVWALNSDDWLIKRKGYIFMKWKERKEILSSIRNVDKVIAVDDSDGSIIKAIEEIKPDYFGHGGNEYKILEKEICETIGVKLIWNLGGDVKFKAGDTINCVINFLI